MPHIISGVEDQNLVTRRDTIRLHIHNLMEEMYQEEEVLKAKLIESVAHCMKELAELCTQLSVPFDGVRNCCTLQFLSLLSLNTFLRSLLRVSHWQLKRKNFVIKRTH